LALPSQTYFLLSRVRQLRLSSWPAEGRVVSDYGFCQDRIYAEAKLNGEDLACYQALGERLAPLVREPDVLIALDAPIEMLKKRIALRGREFEAAFDEAFLTTMREAYFRLSPPADCDLLAVDCGQTDLSDPARRAELIEKIQEIL